MRRFYQHIEDSSDWAWRMCWGHASSEDLVRWVREPMALRPTQGAARGDARHSPSTGTVPAVFLAVVVLRGRALFTPLPHDTCRPCRRPGRQGLLVWLLRGGSAWRPHHPLHRRPVCALDAHRLISPRHWYGWFTSGMRCHAHGGSALIAGWAPDRIPTRLMASLWGSLL